MSACLEASGKRVLWWVGPVRLIRGPAGLTRQEASVVVTRYQRRHRRRHGHEGPGKSAGDESMNPSWHQVWFRPERLWRMYLFAVALVLLLAGFAKSVGLRQEAGFLSNPNSLFSFITNRQLMTGVAILEIAVAVLIFSNAFELGFKLKMVCWLSSQFAIYRAALFISKEPEACKCFGDIFGWLGMGDATIQNVTTSLFLFLLIPSSVWVGFNYMSHYRSSRQ
jgi:hypothetical protein